MNQGLIPRRYAKALYKVGLERGCVKPCYAMMNSLAAAFDHSTRLKDTVANPFVSIDDKTALIAAAAGVNSTDALFADFFKLLVQNRRIDIVDDIARAYTDIYRKANNISRVEVVSASPIDSDATARISRLIAAHLPADATMELSSRIDPEIIGGFIVNIDNERLDASVSSQLKELRLSLLK
ncbi:MAG: ATP synthase F1 subunit delta [Muribaculaceae bacterium]